jgi:hypothetical protein
MEIVVSSRVKIHALARVRFTDWARHHGQSFAPLKAALESAQGRPAGAIQMRNGRWIWAFGETFVTYVLKDEPVAKVGPTTLLPFFVDRFVIVTDIFAV